MIVDTNMKRRIDDLVMELTEEFGEPPDEAEEAMNARPSRPDILVKTVVATRDDIHAFGRQLAAAAWQRGFAGSERKAFVADGLAANWTVWRKHFSHYTPIKQINRRVKGSEKFWNSDGAEALLQLSADRLSETDPLTPFWRQRKSTSGQRRYHAAV